MRKRLKKSKAKSLAMGFLVAILLVVLFGLAGVAAETPMA